MHASRQWLFNLVHDACCRGDLEALELLLSPDVPIDDYYVYQAASRGFVHILRFLRENNNNHLHGLVKYAYQNRRLAALEYMLQLPDCPRLSDTELLACPQVPPGDYYNTSLDKACLALVNLYRPTTTT